MEKIFLHIPEYDELWYREKIMSDSLTMSYNSGYDIDCDGYDKSTGCMAFPEKQWRVWYNYFIGNEPERFYAYLVRSSDGAFIGEVNLHSSEKARYDMGIVIEGKYRGKGYAVEGLKLLLEHAFKVLHAEVVCNDFENERVAALKAHLAAGFEICGEDGGVLHLEISKERYLKTV